VPRGGRGRTQKPMALVSTAARQGTLYKATSNSNHGASSVAPFSPFHKVVGAIRRECPSRVSQLSIDPDFNLYPGRIVCPSARKARAWAWAWACRRRIGGQIEYSIESMQVLEGEVLTILRLDRSLQHGPQ
jgi:hypothetical protein